MFSSSALRRPTPRTVDRRQLLALAASSVAFAGCPLSVPSMPPGGDSAVPTGDADGPDELGLLIDRVRSVLDRERLSRGLSTELHGAWQIFHGILAYGKAFQVDTPSGRVPALQYFADGGLCPGFRPVLGDALTDPASSGRGIRVDLQAETKIGQGHRDQWLAVVTQAGLNLDSDWIVDGHRLRIADWLRQAEWDVPRNYEAEFSWTLIPLSLLRPTDHAWVARDGMTYSTEDLLGIECQQEPAESVCGGTHRLIGIATAVNRRMKEQKPMTGVWAEAKGRLMEAIELARSNQNPDGSYSTAYMHRGGWCQDLGEVLGTTGHVLEFLAMAGEDDLLRSSWVRRSVQHLCDVLDRCQGVDLECGVLYHALHGLSEYQRRMA